MGERKIQFTGLVPVLESARSLAVGVSLHHRRSDEDRDPALDSGLLRDDVYGLLHPPARLSARTLGGLEPVQDVDVTRGNCLTSARETVAAATATPIPAIDTYQGVVDRVAPHDVAVLGV